MPTTRTWIGGGSNAADNPKDWSPNGVPLPGDVMLLTKGTINISNYDLGNNPAFPGIVGFNTALVVDGNATINLSHGATVLPVVVAGHTTINAHGDDNIYLQVGSDPNVTGEETATVNLAANSHLIGGFSVFPGGTLVINGGHDASFVNDSGSSGGGSGVDGVGARAVINADITGHGFISAFDGGKLEVRGSVGAGQTIIVSANTIPGPGGTLQVDHPSEFLGQVELDDGAIDLNGLARADSYSYANDMLSIYAGRTIIDKLSLSSVGSGALPLTVAKTASGVAIYTANDISPPVGHLLPLHG